MQELTEDRVVAIDGKTLRGSADHEAGRAAIHMVSAWATENKLSLGQVVVAEKSNEITAIPNLLDLLEIAGALVSIDAMGCQRDIAGKIRDRKADYILAVKQNQPTLYQRVGAAIAEALEGDAEALDEHETVEKGHGRRETRTYAVVAAPRKSTRRGMARPQRRGNRDLGAGGIEWTGEQRSPLLHPESPDHGARVRRGGTRALGHREQPTLAAGRKLP